MAKLSFPKLQLKIGACREPFITDTPKNYIEAMEFLDEFTAFLKKYGWAIEDWRKRVDKEYQKSQKRK